MNSHRFLIGIVFAFVHLGVSPAFAQIEEEDLSAAEARAGVSAALLSRFEYAEGVFASAEQSQSILLFGELIEELEAERQENPSDELTELLASALSYRARANFNFGSSDAARSDLERALLLAPDFDLDRDTVSTKLLDLFDRSRDSLIGYLEILAEPPDVQVFMQTLPSGDTAAPTDGADPASPLPPEEPATEELTGFDAGSIPLVAGRRALRIERAGYETEYREVEVKAGDTTTVELQMVRSSAVIVLRTRPTGATVVVNGQPRGETSGEAAPGTLLPSQTGGFPREEFSAALLIGGLDVGPQEVEIRHPGFRPYRGRFEATELRDYILQPIVLEQEAGTLVLNNLPRAATVLANGQPVRPSHRSATPTITLSPGNYRIFASLNPGSVFETTLAIADRQTLEIEVDLRPPVLLVGVLGDDDVARDRLIEHLQQGLSRLGRWTLLDRRTEASESLRALGVEKQRLRSMATSGQIDGAGVDWDQVQKRLGERLPAELYLLAVLSDDLLAREAELWVWPAAPSPSRPDVRQINIETPEAIESFTEAFSPSSSRLRLRIGALFIDSSAAPAPLVAQVTPGTAAANAGLEVGDLVGAVDGVPVFTAAQLRKILEEGQSTASVKLELQSDTGGTPSSRTVTLERQWLPSVIDLGDPDLLYAVVSADLEAALNRQTGDTPRWILQLNQAAVLLQAGAWEEAVRSLRRIEVPRSDAMGQGTVAYWLGLALQKAGPSYLELAREKFEQAAESDGRLFHADGPWIRPRARARLEALGVSQ